SVLRPHLIPSSNATYHTQPSTLSLHDALPIWTRRSPAGAYGMCWPTRTTSRNVGKRLPAPSMTDRSRPPAWGWGRKPFSNVPRRSEEHTSELQSLTNLGCRLLLEKKKESFNQI